MTGEQIRENMAQLFQELGMTEQQAARAAQGRNGPLLHGFTTPVRVEARETRSAASPRIPTQREISDEIASGTAALLLEEHSQRLSREAGKVRLPTLEESKKRMAELFQSTGMTEASAKIAAEGGAR